MKISQRVRSIEESPIRKLIPYADEAKARGKKIFHLNIGQPDVETPPGFLKAIKDFDQKVISYSTSRGSLELIDAMRSYYRGYSMNFERENILVTNGGSDALLLTIMVTCDPGDEILIPEPFYANYNSFCDCLNVKLKPITTKAEGGGPSSTCTRYREAY